MTQYINIFAGPGAGKSTLAAELFATLKKQGKSVELVTEFAKDLVWENRKDTLQIQPYVSMKQFRNLARLKGKVDYVITDSPILKDSVYARKLTSLPQSYYDLLGFLHNELGPSTNILLTRSTDYDTNGRLQTETEAISIDKDIRFMLLLQGIDFYECKYDMNEVLEAVFQG